MVALLGWNPFCYGHLGKGSVHPSLDALVGVGLEGLELMIDFLFSFHEQGARPPPMLMLDGELRPLLHAALATMLMYYHERFLNSEMHHVLICMREAYSRTLGTPGEDAHSKLIEWGLAIRLKFDIDNLHLTAKPGWRVIQALKRQFRLSSSLAARLPASGWHSRMSRHARCASSPSWMCSLVSSPAHLVLLFQPLLALMLSMLQLLLWRQTRPPLLSAPPPPLPRPPPPLLPAPQLQPPPPTQLTSLFFSTPTLILATSGRLELGCSVLPEQEGRRAVLHRLHEAGGQTAATGADQQPGSSCCSTRAGRLQGYGNR